MSKVKVNYKSDLPPIEVTFKVNNVAVDVPDHDFSLRFYVEDGNSSYYCGCNYSGGSAGYYNCAPSTDGSKLICYINNHSLMPGRLLCEYIDLAGNANYDDGVFKVVVPQMLDIVLVDGVGEIPSSLSVGIDEKLITKGISSITKTGAGGGASGLEDTYTVTFSDGSTTTFIVTNGAAGPTGVGFSSVTTPSPADGTVIITLTNGDTITLNLNHDHLASQVGKTVTSTSDATVTLSADVIYDLGTVATGTTRTIALPSTVVSGAEYEFRVASTGGTLTLPSSGVTIANDATLTFTSGKSYEVIIVGYPSNKGLLYFSETTTPS